MNSTQRIRIILLVSAFGLSVCGCGKIEPGGMDELGKPGEMRVWAVSDMVALTDRTVPFGTSPSSPRTAGRSASSPPPMKPSVFNSSSTHPPRTSQP